MSGRTPLGKPAEVAAYLRKPPKTLANWRSLGTGPRWTKVGHEVRYRWADVDAWLESHAAQAGEGSPR